MGLLDFPIEYSSAVINIYAIGYSLPRGDREERLRKRCQERRKEVNPIHQKHATRG